MVPSFLQTLQENGRRFPDKPAIINDDWEAGIRETLTYGQLEENIRRTMELLRSRGVTAGDRIALQLSKGLPFVYLHLAVMRLGAVSLPLNPGYPAHELTYFVNDAEARLLFIDRPLAADLEPHRAGMPHLQEAIAVDPADSGPFAALIAPFDPDAAAGVPLPPAGEETALMIYTSGTTGRPKGAMLTHGNLSHNIDALHRAWGWQADDRLLHVLPIFHAHGLLVALHGALNAGATCLMHPRFDPERTLRALVDERCTVFMAVPTIHRKLVEYPDAGRCDLSHMRLLTSGSDRLPDDLFTAFQQTFGHTLLERYGMSETSMNLSNPLHGERRVGSVGLPLPYVEARIVDPESGEPLPDGQIGEVQIRGPHVCKGYWRQPDKTAEAFTADGWLKTGDLGLREPDGYFILKGRSKDLIISGGYNIYPPEVELVLADHPAVAASAVVGCPDSTWGEVVTAVVILRPGAAATAEEIQQFCREKLVNYKIPRRVIFTADVPRNAMGKVQKVDLRRQFCGRAGN